MSENPAIRVLDTEVVSERFGTLAITTFAQHRRDGSWQERRRETYDRGNGAVILPYDIDRATVLLTRQFRYPAYANGHPDGMLIEAAAGTVEPGEDPAETIRRESVEEMGLEIGELEHLFSAYVSPGAATERQDYYAAPYTPAARVGPGGGLREEGEDIEVLEYDFADARALVASGEIVDAKTIVLLQWAALDGPFSG